jgi:hypothetical protein
LDSFHVVNLCGTLMEFNVDGRRLWSPEL